MTLAATGRSISRRLVRALPVLGNFVPTPRIRVHGFPRRHPELLVGGGPRNEGTGLVSQVCRLATLESPTFQAWLERLGTGRDRHRKNWELAYICQALEERGMLVAGSRGLGFAVGTERLPAFFASRGCRITATDLPPEDGRRGEWQDSQQWAGSLKTINAHGLCAADAFQERVEFRAVDMNRVPDDLRGYDFTWSTCSFEHCGSLELGLRFLERQLECLRPGGLAVHTTEFNLSSNDRTVAVGGDVIYRLRDLEDFMLRVMRQDHHVEPLDLDPGSSALDRHVDTPPYHGSTGRARGGVKHLRLAIGGFASTSIGIIIRRAA